MARLSGFTRLLVEALDVKEAWLSAGTFLSLGASNLNVLLFARWYSMSEGASRFAGRMVSLEKRVEEDIVKACALLS